MYFEDILETKKLKSVGRRVTQEQINAFAIAGGDENPLHLDTTKLTIAHGELMAAIMTALGAQMIGYENIFRHHSTSTEFVSSMRPGDLVSAEMWIKEVEDERKRFAVVRFGTELKNQNDNLLAEGERVLTIFKRPR